MKMICAWPKGAMPSNLHRRGQNAKPAWALGDPTEGGVVFSGAHSADCAFAVGGAVCPTGGLAKQQCGLEGKVTPPPTAKFTCPANQALLVLRLTDSWGDGWNGADISVEQNGNVLATDTLQDGAYKEYNHCLAPGCYSITTTSGRVARGGHVAGYRADARYEYQSFEFRRGAERPRHRACRLRFVYKHLRRRLQYITSGPGRLDRSR